MTTSDETGQLKLLRKLFRKLIRTEDSPKGTVLTDRFKELIMKKGIDSVRVKGLKMAIDVPPRRLGAVMNALDGDLMVVRLSLTDGTEELVQIAEVEVRPGYTVTLMDLDRAFEVTFS